MANYYTLLWRKVNELNQSNMWDTCHGRKPFGRAWGLLVLRVSLHVFQYVHMHWAPKILRKLYF